MKVEKVVQFDRADVLAAIRDLVADAARLGHADIEEVLVDGDGGPSALKLSLHLGWGSVSGALVDAARAKLPSSGTTAKIQLQYRDDEEAGDVPAIDGERLAGAVVRFPVH